MPENSKNPERYALENVYMLAKRENNRKAQDERSKEMWGHVIRLCESAGLASTILRSYAVDVSPRPSTTKTKITVVGQPCRHCATPVVRREHVTPPKYKAGSYYYEWWLACPKCRALYMIEAAKVLFDGPDTSEPRHSSARRPEPHIGPVAAVFDPLAVENGVAPW